MTEAEKRALALQIMAQEQARLASTSFHDHQNATIADLHHEITTRQQYYNDFAQQGITFRDFQNAYSDAYEQGRSDMLAYRFSFFYAATAIAYHEIFSASPDDVATFMKALPKAQRGARTMRSWFSVAWRLPALIPPSRMRKKQSLASPSGTGRLWKG